MIVALWVQSMLVTDRFPESGTDLVTTLTSGKMDLNG